MIKHYKNAREHRKVRLRHTVKGTADRPRMSVFRSAKHIYVQVINDDAGLTLAAASTLDPSMKTFEGNKTAAAKAVGQLAAERALANGVTKLVFDRNGFRYCGRIAAVSQAAHEMGLLTKEGHSATSGGDASGQE